MAKAFLVALMTLALSGPAVAESQETDPASTYELLSKSFISEFEFGMYEISVGIEQALSAEALRDLFCQVTREEIQADDASLRIIVLLTTNGQPVQRDPTLAVYIKRGGRSDSAYSISLSRRVEEPGWVATILEESRVPFDHTTDCGAALAG